MKDIKLFEKDIRENLKNNGTKYLKSQQYKPEAAYKMKYDKKISRSVSNAWSIPVFRAVSVWNSLYPKDQIYSLTRVSLLKLIVTSEKDLDVIKDKYPNEYKIILEKIFHSHSPEIVKAGLKVIAIPSSSEKFPDWIKDLIDYDVIVSDVIASFRSILEALKIESINIKTPNGKAVIPNALISI